MNMRTYHCRIHGFGELVTDPREDLKGSQFDEEMEIFQNYGDDDTEKYLECESDHEGASLQQGMIAAAYIICGRETFLRLCHNIPDWMSVGDDLSTDPSTFSHLIEEDGDQYKDDANPSFSAIHISS